MSIVPPLTLTPVDHWLKHVETARFLFFIASLGSRFWSWVEIPPADSWAAVPHWLRETFTDAQCLDTQSQDRRAFLCELHSGRSLPDTEVSRSHKHYQDLSCFFALIVCSHHSTLGVRDSELTDGKTPCPHHRQSMSFHDPLNYVVSFCHQPAVTLYFSGLLF